MRETLFQEESLLLDSDASNKAADADAALQELGSDLVAYGYVTTTITLSERDLARLDGQVRAAERGIEIPSALEFDDVFDGISADQAGAAAILEALGYDPTEKALAGNASLVSADDEEASADDGDSLDPRRVGGVVRVVSRRVRVAPLGHACRTRNVTVGGRAHGPPR